LSRECGRAVLAPGFCAHAQDDNGRVGGVHPTHALYHPTDEDLSVGTPAPRMDEARGSG